jgi:lipid II:glycine glycyltransferase (peptidoglycan interpeptide bridge formation enzyme)
MNDSISIKILDSSSKKALDEFVYKNPNTSIFQTPDMVEVYRRNKGCIPLVLVAVDEDTGEIRASLLAKIKEEKRGFLSSFSRHSTIRGGPLLVDSKEGVASVLLLLRRYNKVIEKDALYSRLYPLNDFTRIVPYIKKNGYEYGDWQNFLINLDKPVNEIWRQLKKSRRYGINKAKKKGVTIEEIREKELIPVFYDLLQDTYRNRNIVLEGISNFEATFDIMVPKNKAKFFMAKYEGKYIAAILILLYKGIVYDWYAGSSQKQEDLVLCPNDLIAWYVIEWGANNGFHTFDFGGGGEPGDTSGWIEFKRQFGGKLVNYGRYTKIHQPKKLWFSEKMFEVYRKLIFT